jgi:hypothetical protein
MTWWRWALFVALSACPALVVPRVAGRVGGWTGDVHDAYAAAYFMGIVYAVLLFLIFRPPGVRWKTPPSESRGEVSERPRP